MNPEPLFFDVDEVLEIHAENLLRTGGGEGLRDLGLLESAISQPRSTFGGSFLHTDLAKMAAAYLFHICKNHPFVDGNKRTAVAVALIFLEVNGVEIVTDTDAFEQLTLGTACGTVSKAQIADFFRSRIT